MSCDNDATRGFGPLLPGNLKVDFGDAAALEEIFKGMNNFLCLPSLLLLIFAQNFILLIETLVLMSKLCFRSILYITAEKGDKIAGFLFEPIQGEAGVSSFFLECLYTYR